MEQIEELLQRAHQGDKKARDTLVANNLGLVWSIVKRFENRGREKEELFQIGSIGLIKAIDKFDFSFAVKFSTYAVPVISGEIRRFLRDDGLVKVSRTLKENAWKIKEAQRELEQQLGREATVEEISARTGITKEDIVMALDASASVESIYKTVYQSDGNELYLVDQVVGGTRGVGQANGSVLGESGLDETGKLLNEMVVEDLMKDLGEVERALIELRYFQDKTQSETAQILGLNQVKVSRLEKKILLQMREKLGHFR